MASLNIYENGTSMTQNEPEKGHPGTGGERTVESSGSHPGTSTSTTTSAKDMKRIRRYLNDLQDHRAEFLKTLPSTKTPPVLTALDSRLDRLDFSFSLATAMDYLTTRQFYHAKKEAHCAIHIADRLNNYTLLARCFYWLGRIEFQQRRMAAAHAHFRAAKLLTFDAEYPESCDVRAYAKASRPNVSKDNHKGPKKAAFDEKHQTCDAETHKGLQTIISTHQPLLELPHGRDLYRDRGQFQQKGKKQLDHLEEHLEQEQL